VLSARHVATCLLVLGAIGLAAPAVTVAAGGGSAGDQQYTDPFAASTKTSTSTPAPPPATTSAPVATTPAPAAAPATATTPTATIASPTPTTAATSSHGSLPYTGYDSWVAGAVGAVLVAGGLGLRRRAQRA
jgi:LPXTG-motif cell wall-anchored protein